MSYQLARQAIYALKRQFPLPLDVYFPDTPAFDVETGVITQNATKVHIRKGVLLPSKEEREGRYNRSYIRWAVGFTYGGYHDHNTRGVLIDLKDIPSPYVIDVNCWVIIDHQRYEVKTVILHEQAKAVALECVRLQGAPTYEQHTPIVRATISFTDTASGVKA